VSRDPTDPWNRERLAALHYNIGNLRLHSHRPDVLDSFQLARTIYEALARDQPSVAQFRAGLARAEGSIANFRRGQLQFEAALAGFQKAHDLLQGLVQEHPSSASFRTDLAITCANIGALHLDSGRVSEALHSFEEGRVVLEQLVRDNSKDLRARSILGMLWQSSGDALAALERPDDALSAYQRAIELQRTVHQAAPQVDEYRRYLNDHYKRFASLKRDLGQLADARATILSWREVIDDPSWLYDVARELALCLQPVGNEGKTKRETAAFNPQSLQDEVIETLRQAIGAGYRDAEELGRDPAFDPLRKRPDFQALVEDLSFPENPFVE
jgi:eukaryotic-like serine/threonine-protein kinase